MYRGYDGRAEIGNFSSKVEKYFTSERSEQVKYFFNTREISYLQMAMLCSIYYINTNEIPSHFTLIVSWYERRKFLCSHSNGDIFTCENIFSHERSPGDSLVFISAMFVFTHIHSWRAILLSISTTVIPTYS